MLETDPPLTPISDDVTPIRKPYPVMATRPGKSSAIRQLSRPNRSLKAIIVTTTRNTILKTAAGAKKAITEPAATPSTAGSAHCRMTSRSTAPLARCVRYERMVVGRMIAIEVPTHSCIRTSSGTPRMRNTSYSTGTMIAPPPMPNRPARMPVATPPTTTARASKASSPNGTPSSIEFSGRT